MCGCVGLWDNEIIKGMFISFSVVYIASFGIDSF